MKVMFREIDAEEDEGQVCRTERVPNLPAAQRLLQEYSEDNPWDKVELYVYFKDGTGSDEFCRPPDRVIRINKYGDAIITRIP